MGIDIYRGNDKQLTEGAINTTARPGAVDPRAQQIDVFPLDAFEFDDPKRTTPPVVRLKSPWKWEVQSEIDSALDDIAVLQAMTVFETRYKKSLEMPTTPTGDDPTGWTTYIPSEDPALPVWQSGATRDSFGLIVGSWYDPVRFTGAATLVAALTNDIHQVPTDIDGNFGNYAGAESKLLVYEGDQYVTDEFEMDYEAFAGITVDDSYFVANDVVKVTAMSVDSGYVELIGTRLGVSVRKRFSISKAKQGDAAPAYSLSASTVVALVKPTGVINPETINFSSTYQVGTTPPQPYEAIFRFLVNGVEQSITTTKQSSYAWMGFGDILIDDISEILLYDSPDIILPFVYSGSDALAYMTVEIWSPKVGTDEGEWLPDVLLDSQSVTFIADWENYQDDMLGVVPDFVPRYLGRFGPLEAELAPASYRKYDTWLIYNASGTPERGVYYYDGNLPPYRLEDAVSSKSGLIVAALPDILWATSNGYGSTAMYGAVTYIENLVANAIFTEKIQIGQSNVIGLGTSLDTTQAQAELLAKDALAYRLGYDDWSEMELDARLSSTLIDGGYLRTTLIEVEKLLTQYITVKSGGSIRYETGSGVQKRCVQLADEKIDWLDTPLTSPATAEQLRARIGRLGVGGSVLMDGDILSNITSSWSSPFTLSSTEGTRPSYVMLANGEARIAYRRSIVAYIIERVLPKGSNTWGAETVISTTPGSSPTYVQLQSGELRLAYSRASDNYLVEKIYNFSNSTWGVDVPGFVADSSAQSRYIQLKSGILRILYPNSSNYLCERIYNFTNSTWGSEVVIDTDYNTGGAYLERENEELRIVYTGTTGVTYLRERIYNNTTQVWGAYSVIASGGSYLPPRCITLLNGEVRLGYISYNTNWLFVERILNADTGIWGSEAIQFVTAGSVASGFDYLLEADGNDRVAYTDQSIYVVERYRQRYARLGAGIVSDTNNGVTRYLDFSNRVRLSFPLAGGTVTASIL